VNRKKATGAGGKYQDRAANSAVLIFPEFFAGDAGIGTMVPFVAIAKRTLFKSVY
jgi:hypothetical protein